MSHTSDSADFLRHVPADGTAIGNIKLRQLLGWEEEQYTNMRDALVWKGVLATGKGRGGAVMLAGSAQEKAPAVDALEMFAAADVTTPAPAKRVAASSPKAPKVSTPPVTTYQFADATRKNIPPAGLASKSTVQEAAPHRLSYDPHLTPVLRFDSTGGTDHLMLQVQDILDKAKISALTPEETQLLSEALLRSRQPWLEWAGKREKRWFEVDPVALHIHERVSANAILKAAQRQDIEHDLFADPRLSREEALQFYKHDVYWANRLILGDSLQVMSSLARREGLAGKVQMIYIDPPYGIKFSSNWQNEVGNRDVKDKNEDLTREPEMIKAYRDTWTLGVHSYLDYLKQRLIVARELLTDSGSIFVQISDENLHRVRAVMDEVFGAENFCAIIAFVKTSGVTQRFLPDRFDHLIWYARAKEKATYIQPYASKNAGDDSATNYNWCELPDCSRRGLTKQEKENKGELPEGFQIYKPDNITSQGNPVIPFDHVGRVFAQGWKTNLQGLARLGKANRLHVAENSLQYVRALTDFPAVPLTKLWTDTQTGNFTDEKVYVVQTGTKTIERCIQMTTKPGELVLDPTSGSGTTAAAAEQWGRRWIAIDSSRVAVAVARQRLLTAKFDTYKTKDASEGIDPDKPKNPGTGFHYKTVPHITLKSIAQNKSLDPIFDKHEPILAGNLQELNRQLAKVTKDLKGKLAGKLIAKHQQEGGRAVTDADQRRWLLPGTDPQLIQSLKGGKGLSAISIKQAEAYRAAIPANDGWQEWEVPFDTDPDWPQSLQDALTAYRQAWRAKMDEVNACIEANAEQEELVDQPEIVKGSVRVTGPFTVESVRPLEDSLKGIGHEAPDSPIDGAPEELEDSFETPERDVTNAANHIERMIALLRTDGLTFTGNKHLRFERLDPIESEFLHADGETFSKEGEEPRRVAVVIGPEHGSVGSFQVNTAVSSAIQRGYDDIIFAAFAFDASSQDRIHETNENPANKLNAIMAQIRPDVLLGDLLKGNKAGGKAAETAKASQQLFTVFGQPRTRIEHKGTEYTAHMDGVDVYDPVKNSIEATKAGKVAAWFLDTDYDGRTFCICQAFFPDKTAWEKLAKALSGTIDPEAFAAFSGTKSLPFHIGEHKRVAIKVIDPRGNEVMRVHSLS